MEGTQTFSSIAGGITDSAPPQSQTQQTQPSASGDGSAPPNGAPPDVPVKRPPGRPKGSKNKNKSVRSLDPNSTPVKRPVGRPRKNKDGAEPVQKRPVGRPRKDGLPSGSGQSNVIQPQQYQNAGDAVLVNDWASKYSRSVSAVPNEWLDLAFSKPDEFLQVLLTSLDMPNPVTVEGPTVHEAFKSHLGSLAPAPNTSATSTSSAPAIPSLYSILKTFWLPSSPSYFALTTSATSTRPPSSHRFLYWDPQPLCFNGIACPTCTSPLTNLGRIRSGPITVHDVTGPFYIIGCKYVCINEHAYASTDTSVLAALPAPLEREFPARLLAGDAGASAEVWNWQARGVSRSLWNLVLGALRAGCTQEVILQLVRDVQNGVPDGSTDAPSDADAEAVMEEDAEGSMDASPSAPPPPPLHGDAMMVPGRPSQAQAFNDAWAANSVNTALPSGSLPVTMPMYMPPGYPVGLPPPQVPQKRGFPFGDDPAANGSGGSPPKQRQPRHCVKCGSQACKGKGGSAFCASACRDCGKLTCGGRTSRRPGEPCEGMAQALQAQGQQVQEV
ncbi:hypothetical protein FB45DRAFT_820257 [Roridomyces roridus]|uniref:Uncharacterized protein n=1 Tax=Roridomyces roridus TaxID=1738132 RepID=A0AAD7CK49_9AGAR|nr:hypothetical protein FB45DRAFT_820257 [Roridomyces roridus]